MRSTDATDLKLRGAIVRNVCGAVFLSICLTELALLPTAADALRPLCPDRPGKGTSPCTLDKGYFQIEIDGFDTTSQKTDGTSLRTTIIANPTLKYGLTDTLDVEASLAPYIEQRTRDSFSSQLVSGEGDLYLRGKWNFLRDGGRWAAVIAPFVKAPTATSGLGNGAWEGGMVLPLSYDLGDNWSLSSTPEADILLNAAGSGRHLTAINVVGLGRELEGGVSLGAEIWTSQDFDPAGVTSQYSFDLDGAWQPSHFANVQFDVGVNFGLNRSTPGAKFYFGFSRRI